MFNYQFFMELVIYRNKIIEIRFSIHVANNKQFLNYQLLMYSLIVSKIRQEKRRLNANRFLSRYNSY